MIAILRAGLQSSVQDCGRFGYRRLGVTTAGALDVASMRLAQLLVGNDEGAAGIELGGGRFVFQAKSERLFAWSGGEYRVTIGGEDIPSLHTAKISPGETVELQAVQPSRTWFALSGEIDVPEVMGSRSTDVRAGFGGANGRFLRDGDELPLGAETPFGQSLRRNLASRRSSWSAPRFPVRKERLRVVAGKDWNDERGAELQRAPFQVALNSDRMGLRLEGTAMATSAVEQISEPVAPGTIQVPRDGLPIVLLADAQTIGGYPRLAHVVTVDLADAAQLQPRDQVRFVCVSLEEARGWLAQRERDIALFRTGLQTRFGFS